MLSLPYALLRNNTLSQSLWTARKRKMKKTTLPMFEDDNNSDADVDLEDLPEHERFERSWFAAKTLAKKFLAKQQHYLSNEYQEAQVRQDFVDKLFNALGWDVYHDKQHDPYRQEVRIEKPEKKAKGRADYAFSLAPHYRRVRFFAEAKRPQANIATADNCFQAIRYSWPKGLPIAVLTDFNSIYVLDSRFQPKIESAQSCVVRKWYCSDFEDRHVFSELYWLLSREAVDKGSIDLFAENELPQPQLATKQYSLFASEAREFDEVFLQQLDNWRQSLASTFKRANQKLTNEQLTECVQRTIDRLVFIRFLEDKRIEQSELIVRFGQGTKPHWQDFVATCRRLDSTYNGIVFKPHSILDNNSFTPNSKEFAVVCDELTDEHTPYNFDSIPVEILGRIYERFLGKVVQATTKSVEVVEKDDVRKAGGVYYTPGYIVAYMVHKAIGERIKSLKPEQIMKFRAIDTACGSGSFLIGTFSYLLEVIGAYFLKYPKEAKKGILEERNGEHRLSLQFKRLVLTNCIFGVDIDPQAVEVAQLSLYLKLMEDETTVSAHHQQIEMGVALLPTLSANIVVGNSLVTLDEDLFSFEKIRETRSLNFPAQFPQAFSAGGFDLVIGNPPYIKEYTNKSAFDHVRQSPYFEGKMDIWYLFACRALDFLKPDTGVLAYIATNNWVTNAGAKKFRSKITREATIEQLIDFGDFKVFRDAGIQTMILIALKSHLQEIYQFDFRRLSGAKRTLADAQNLLDKIDGKGRQYLSATMDRSRSKFDLLTFSDDDSERLLAKISAKRNFHLDGQLEVAQGIVPNPDVVSKKAFEMLSTERDFDSSIRPRQGVFVVDQRHFKSVTTQERRFLKPLYEPTDVGRYSIINEASKNIIYSTRANTRDNPLPPRLLTHLEKFKGIMELRRENQLKKLSYFQLHWPRDERFFARGGKILSVRKCAVPTFAFTESEAYVMMSFNVIKTERINLKYLTALLNSRLVRFWLANKGKMQGENYQVDKEPLLQIPLFSPSKNEQTKIEKLVTRIIDCKQSIADAKTDSEKEQLYRLIDQADLQIQTSIERLYELDPAECEILNKPKGSLLV